MELDAAGMTTTTAEGATDTTDSVAALGARVEGVLQDVGATLASLPVIGLGVAAQTLQAVCHRGQTKDEEKEEEDKEAHSDTSEQSSDIRYHNLTCNALTEDGGSDVEGDESEDWECGSPESQPSVVAARGGQQEVGRGARDCQRDCPRRQGLDAGLCCKEQLKAAGVLPRCCIQNGGRDRECGLECPLGSKYRKCPLDCPLRPACGGLCRMCPLDCPLRPGCEGLCRMCPLDCPLRPGCGGQCRVVVDGREMTGGGSSPGQPGPQLALPAPPPRPALPAPPAPPQRPAIPLPAPGAATPPLPVVRASISENSLQKVHQLVAYFSSGVDSTAAAATAAEGEASAATASLPPLPDDSLTSQMSGLPVDESAPASAYRPADNAPAAATANVAAGAAATPAPRHHEHEDTEEASVSEAAASDDDLSDAESHGTDRLQRALQHLSSKLTLCLTEIKKQQSKVQAHQREKARLDGLAQRAAEKLAAEEAKLRRLKEKGQRRTGKLKTTLDEMNSMP